MLGIETQIGLSLVRELGEAGVPVVGIATGDKAIGLQSRYLAHGEILNKPRTDAGLAELRAIGERQAYRYFQTAERISASRARELGLVHEVAEPEQLDAAVQAAANSRSRRSPPIRSTSGAGASSTIF